jgi:ABC-type branched-subunit amino acid transport system substrate-binding protein
VVNLAKAEKSIGLNIAHLGPGYANKSTIDLGGSDVEGAMFVDTTDLNKPQWKEFEQKYRKRFNIVGVFNVSNACQPYDAVYLLAQGLAKTKGQVGEALKDALEKGVAVDGVIGSMGTPGARWSKGRHDALMADDLVMNIVRGGQFVTLPR